MRIYSAAGALTGWFAVVFQLYLIIQNRVMSIISTIFQYFSYFTILTNILVALAFTFIVVAPDSRRGKFFRQPKVLTAIAVYITVVGLVYNLILRFLWAPSGLQLVVDELLHSVMPVAFVIFWLAFVPKGELQWKDVFPWLLYPLIYLIYILLRGAGTGRYPYPFIDVNTLGYSRVLLHCGGLFLVFFLLSLLFVGIGRVSAGRRAKTA